MLPVELQWVWGQTQHTNIKSTDLRQTVPKCFLQIFSTNGACLTPLVLQYQNSYLQRTDQIEKRVTLSSGAEDCTWFILSTLFLHCLREIHMQYETFFQAQRIKTLRLASGVTQHNPLKVFSQGRPTTQPADNVRETSANYEIFRDI